MSRYEVVPLRFLKQGQPPIKSKKVYWSRGQWVTDQVSDTMTVSRRWSHFKNFSQTLSTFIKLQLVQWLCFNTRTFFAAFMLLLIMQIIILLSVCQSIYSPVRSVQVHLFVSMHHYLFHLFPVSRKKGIIYTWLKNT